MNADIELYGPGLRPHGYRFRLKLRPLWRGRAQEGAYLHRRQADCQARARGRVGQAREGSRSHVTQTYTAVPVLHLRRSMLAMRFISCACRIWKSLNSPAMSTVALEDAGAGSSIEYRWARRRRREVGL